MSISEELKVCQNCKTEFTIEPEDFLFYQKIKVPPPTWCPECRMIRRFMFRDERHLYRIKDDATGKEIFSGIPNGGGRKIYDTEYWNSDAWDAMEYGRDYDFSRNFFEQLRDLIKDVPHPSRAILRLVNSNYCNAASDLKNCYLCFNSGRSEDCAHCVTIVDTKDSFDLFEARKNELCYEGMLVDDSYRVFFSMDCEHCNDVWFSRDLVGCTFCFGCTGLRNKSYYIFNEPYTKEQYLEKLKEFDLGSHKAVRELRDNAYALWNAFPVKYMHGRQNTNVSGEHIQNSKNVFDSYAIHNGEDLRHCQMVEDKVTDSYDYNTWGEGSSLMYETLESGEQCRNVKFSEKCWPSSYNIEYSVDCRSSSNLFACVGLKNKSYCIFNKQYTPEEYASLREKIIQHMNEKPYVSPRGIKYRYGEFFPIEFSAFAYNQTTAQDFFPLTREEALSRGYQWKDPDVRDFETTLDAKDLPDHIRDIDDSILQQIIKCTECGRAYRIIAKELFFYQKIGLPIPRKCPNCRYGERFQFIPPPKFWWRKCQCVGNFSEGEIYQNQTAHFHGNEHCPNEFETSYAPDRPEIVYCKECYQAEVQ